MQFNFPFTKYFKIASTISVSLFFMSLYFIFGKGINFGVDFKGGAELQVKFSEMVTTDELRTSLANAGIEASSVQSLGDLDSNEYLIKVGATAANINEVTQQISDTLKQQFLSKGLEIQKTDIVGPKAGEELRIAGFLAMFWSLLAIMVYIGLRFDFRYSPGAVIGVFHDVVIVIGVFALLGKEFSLQVVGALLAVIGYSVNDTVVIYDRVREHEEKLSPGSSMTEMINKALNETLSRTFLTVGTTLIVSLALLFWGGTVIHDFFLAITLGLIFGTYSSLFVASPITISLDRWMKNRSTKAHTKPVSKFNV